MIREVITTNTPSDVVTVAQLKAMTPRPKIFVVDEDKSKAYIMATPSTGFYLVNVLTQDVKWKVRESFDALIDRCVEKELSISTYDTLDELTELINDFTC